ncbi:hypothetical protein CC86DRAFT_466847 [Ophiobolus disseminans]|uniref:Uncharacterized protein n=1 Tax=Ophiobolus disseminans TaxID=1469910 RepID=A0A6A7A2P7_9PLEO|nr:hypothetical protein CC86DRAFT_466847 [Ophiobolus disseminans]
MNTLVFATHDVTPEHWTDFANTAGCEPDADGTIHIPYVLVSSRSQENITTRTEHIDKVVKTHFTSSPWPDLKAAFLELYNKHPSTVSPTVFLILDQQSMEDRTVIIIEKGMDWLKDDGTLAHNTGEPDVATYTVWRKYRVGFEEAWTAQCGIQGFCSKEAAEPYWVEDVEREVYVEESGDEDEDETDSDGTTSEDLEYGDFPLAVGKK